MQSNWEKVYETTHFLRIELVKLILEEHNIPNVLINKQASSYQNFGNYELYTLREDVLRAIKIIQDEIHFDQNL